MFVALDKNGNRINIDDANKDEQYFCPICGTEVVLKTGTINAHHFAHKSLKDCDTFSHDMSEWHKTWQSFFPRGNREVVIEFKGEKHRADVLCYGTVIEFQHSPISEDEFWKRNDFYTKAGYKVVWIFDLIEVQKLERIEWYDCWEYGEDNGRSYKWKYPWRFLRDFLPQEEKIIHIFISRVGFPENPKHKESDIYIEKVTWVNEYKYNPWSYIRTSDKICNFYELLDWLKKRWELNKRLNQRVFKLEASSKN